MHRKTRCVHKGIPDCLQGLVWQLVPSSRDLLLMNQGMYEVLILCSFFSLLGKYINSSIEIVMFVQGQDI